MPACAIMPPLSIQYLQYSARYSSQDHKGKLVSTKLVVFGMIKNTATKPDVTAVLKMEY